MISILDYGSGNLSALSTLIKRSNEPFEIIRSPQEISAATRIIVPGVGAFDNTMRAFRDAHIADALKDRALSGAASCLGICVGMHILADSSEEGDEPGLGLISGRVTRFDESRIDSKPKVPHMGWNTVEDLHQHPLLKDINPDQGFYFLHSYYFDCASEASVIGLSEHGQKFHCAVMRAANDNSRVFGVQFHPEKSHDNGIQLIKNFLAL